MKIKITEIKCTLHPTYKAIRPPNGQCWACHLIFWLAFCGKSTLADGSRIVIYKQAKR
jgi:hypothetical protein